MKKVFIILLAACCCAACTPKQPTDVTLSREELLNKIKGGWAGQTIGVVFGAPTEFKFTGTTIQDYQPIPWGKVT